MRNIETWSYPETLDRDNWLIATYFVDLPPSVSLVDGAHGMGIAQTTGSWVQLPDDLMELVESYNGRFEGIYRIPPAELKANPDEKVACVMRIAYPAHIFNNDLTTLLTITLSNELSTSQEIKLLDLQFPPIFLDQLPGPRFGVQGIRDKLGVYDRPLLLNVIKPCIGLPPEESAKLVYESAFAGIDLIKEDEKLSDDANSPIEKRVRANKAAIQRAEEATGHKTLYIANISSKISKLKDNAFRARDAGADILLVNFVGVGLTALQMLAEDTDLNMPLLTHFNLAQIWYESPNLGISSFLILGKLPRLAGADMVVQLVPYGKYTISLDSFLMYTRALTMPFRGIKPAMPVVGGGSHPRLVPRIVKDLGIDFVAGVGGAIQAHPQGTTAGVRAMRQALDASIRDVPLDIYASEHPELLAALKKW